MSGEGDDMALAKELEVFAAQTTCDIGILLSILSFALHIGRPYFDRILGRFTLKVAADIWWEIYIILRDGSLFIAVLLGFLSLNPDLMADIKIGLPFVPLGTVALTMALMSKLFRNAEDVNRSYIRTVYWVTLGAFLNVFGYVFIMEAPGEEYASAQSAFWKLMVSLRSTQNAPLAMTTFYVAFGLMALIALVATARAIKVLKKTADPT